MAQNLYRVAVDPRPVESPAAAGGVQIRLVQFLWQEEGLAKGCCESGKIGARMPTSARTSLGFFGQFADVGIRAPEQNGLLQQALASTRRIGRALSQRQLTTGQRL